MDVSCDAPGDTGWGGTVQAGKSCCQFNDRVAISCSERRRRGPYDRRTMSNSRVRLAVPVAMAGLAVGMTYVFFVRGGGTPAAARGQGAVLLSSLCEVDRLASAGDGDAAEAKFLDDVHGPMHTLAAATQVRDRAAAADLLEAKQAVELVIERGRGIDDVGDLVAATRRAATVTDRRDPGGCP